MMKYLSRFIGIFIIFLLLVALPCLALVGDRSSGAELPRHVDIIVCLNSSDARVEKVAQLYRQDYAKTALVTYPGTRQQAIKLGLPEHAVTSLQGGFNSTYEEGLAVVAFLQAHNLRSAVVVTDSWHMYRARWTYRHLNKANRLQIGYVAASTAQGDSFRLSDPTMWKIMLLEIPKVAYYWIAHGLLGVKEDPQWITATEKWYCRILKQFA